MPEQNDLDERLQHLIDLINNDPGHMWTSVELHKQLLHVCTHNSVPPAICTLSKSVFFSAEYLDGLFFIVGTLHD